MEVLSFVFLPEPSLCLDSDFKELRTFSISYHEIDETFTIVAMKCYSRSQIAAEIERLSKKYLQKTPTEYNINAAAIMTWCNQVLTQGPQNCVPAFQLVNIINSKCGYATSVTDMMYVPSLNGNWKLFKENIKNLMRG